MGKQTWTVPLEGRPRTILLEHSAWPGKRVIMVDNRPVAEARRWVDFGGIQAFDFGKHVLMTVIAVRGIRFRYDLIVDGISMATGKRFIEPVDPPLWSWFLIVLCGLIPFAPFTGIVPITLGVLGVGACYKEARHPTRSTAAKAVRLVVITAASWVAFFVWVLLMATLSVPQG